MPHETDLMNDLHVDYDQFSLSAVDTNSSILIGRPYGGLTILYRKHLSAFGKIMHFGEVRMLGFQLQYNNLNYLLINVYLPYYCEENIAEFTMCMGKLESILEEYDVNGVLLMGDFNSKPDGQFYAQLINFCSEYPFLVHWSMIIGQLYSKKN